MVLGKESSHVLALESSWHDGVAVVVPPLPNVVTAFDEEQSGRATVGVGLELDSV
jgi:hypothetical protein